MDIYALHIQDHYKNPRFSGLLGQHDFQSEESNPSCGDKVLFQGIVHEGYLKDMRFLAQGCVISQATASMLSEFVVGKSVAFIADLTTDDIKNLVKIPLGPVRLKCALLSLQALQKVLISYQK